MNCHYITVSFLVCFLYGHVFGKAINDALQDNIALDNSLGRTLLHQAQKRQAECDARCQELQAIQKSLQKSQGLRDTAELKRELSEMQFDSADLKSSDSSRISSNDNGGMICDARCQELRKLQKQMQTGNGLADEGLPCNSRCQRLRKMQQNLLLGEPVSQDEIKRTNSHIRALLRALLDDYSVRDVASLPAQDYSSAQFHDERSKAKRGVPCDARCQRLKKIQQKMQGGRNVADEASYYDAKQDSAFRLTDVDRNVKRAPPCDSRCQKLKFLQELLLKNTQKRRVLRKREFSDRPGSDMESMCDERCQYLKLLQALLRNKV